MDWVGIVVKKLLYSLIRHGERSPKLYFFLLSFVLSKAPRIAVFLGLPAPAYAC